MPSLKVSGRRLPKRRRAPGGDKSDSASGVPAGGEAKREKTGNPSPNPSPEKGGDYADIRKSSIGAERDDGDAGGLGAGGGSAPSFAGFVETLKGNVESPETMEAARSTLEQAAVAHLEVRFFCDFISSLFFHVFFLIL